MRKILNWLINFLVERTKQPYVAYITSGISEDGQIKFEMYWNKGLIENLKRNGINGANDHETAMLFLVASQLRPSEFPDPEENVNSEAHPLLSTENQLRT
jgi:hypothetical protein